MVNDMNSRKIIMMFLSILVAVALMLPMIVFAKGEGETITIKPPDTGSWVLNASDFSAIKLFDVSVLFVEGSPNFVYTPVEGLEDFAAIFKVEFDFGDGTANGLRLWLSESPSAADLKNFTKAVMDFGFTSSGIVSGGGTAGNVVISGLDLGYYLVIGSGFTDGEKVVAHSALVTVPEFADDVQKDTVVITLKADAPTIAKSVSNENTSDPDDFVKWTDVSIGDIVTFKIESIVPNMFGYDSYTFIVHDTMDAGLSFVGDTKDDFTVTIGGKSFEQFEVVVTGQTMTLSMQGSIHDKITGDFLDQSAGDAIVITYQAMLNGKATIDKTPNVNTARIEYSNNPYWDGKGKEPTGTTPEDKAKVFVFDFDILKFTGSLDAPIPLAGAKFELRTDEHNAGSAIKLVELISENVGGKMMDVYRVATFKEITDGLFTTIIVTGDSGRVLIRGLDAGDYFLKEVKAPDGFNLREAAVKISIVRIENVGVGEVYDEFFDGSTKVLADGIEIQHTVNVENNTGPELPGTGGSGRTIIYACGGTLAVGILIAYAISKQRKEEE